MNSNRVAIDRFVKNKVTMLPFYLFSYLLSLESFLAEESQEKDNFPGYPIRSNRYFMWGMNGNYQYCYTKDDIALMDRIRATFATINENKNAIYFSVTEVKAWQDWWICIKPTYENLLKQHQEDSFTLPEQESKDIHAYPLSHFADNIARKIANWQAKRVAFQDPELMNDPVMLVFEQLRDLFFSELTQKECTTDTLTELAKHLRYVKSLIYIIPNFGADRAYLLELRQELEQAARIVQHCIANRELPQLLSELIRTGKNLEKLLGTYFHNLLINYQVADNFAPEYLEGSSRNCQDSPVCTIFSELNKASDTSPLVKTQINRFYDFKIREDKQYDLVLKTSVIQKIPFAHFVHETDKFRYLQALATLDAMMNVRSTLEKFHHLQTKLGTYVFAANYLEKSDQLAANYTGLIRHIQQLMHGLIEGSDRGLSLILRNPKEHRSVNRFFEENFRRLETKVAKETTISALLDSYCDKALASMHKYQQAMKKISMDITAGEAERDIQEAMQELMLTMQELNVILPGMLGKVAIKFPTEEPVALEGIPCHVDPLAISSANVTKENVDVIDLFQSPLFDEGHWDSVFDPITNQPIYIFTAFNYDQKVGRLRFLGEPRFCRSQDFTQHNVIEATGIFEQIDFHSASLLTEEICHFFPATLREKMLKAAGKGLISGSLLGTEKVVAFALQTSGVSQGSAQAISQLVYYGGTFSLHFHYHYAQQPDLEEMERCLHALYYAAIETGQAWVIRILLNQVSRLLTWCGNCLEENGLGFLGRSFKNSGRLLQFGFYAIQGIQHGIYEAGATLLTGVASEMAVEQTGRFLIKQAFSSKAL